MNHRSSSPLSSSVPRFTRLVRGGSSQDAPMTEGEVEDYGRISDDEFRLTPQQIETFRREGCVTIPNVLTEQEVSPLISVFDRFIKGEIDVPGKDFCDMSKKFGIPYEEWSIVNCLAAVDSRLSATCN